MGEAILFTTVMFCILFLYLAWVLEGVLERLRKLEGKDKEAATKETMEE